MKDAILVVIATALNEEQARNLHTVFKDKAEQRSNATKDIHLAILGDHNMAPPTTRAITIPNVAFHFHGIDKPISTDTINAALVKVTKLTHQDLAKKIKPEAVTDVILISDQDNFVSLETLQQATGSVKLNFQHINVTTADYQQNVDTALSTALIPVIAPVESEKNKSKSQTRKESKTQSLPLVKSVAATDSIFLVVVATPLPPKFSKAIASDPFLASKLLGKTVEFVIVEESGKNLILPANKTEFETALEKICTVRTIHSADTLPSTLMRAYSESARNNKQKTITDLLLICDANPIIEIKDIPSGLNAEIVNINPSNLDFIANTTSNELPTTNKTNTIKVSSSGEPNDVNYLIHVLRRILTTQHEDLPKMQKLNDKALKLLTKAQKAQQDPNLDSASILKKLHALEQTILETLAKKALRDQEKDSDLKRQKGITCIQTANKLFSEKDSSKRSKILDEDSKPESIIHKHRNSASEAANKLREQTGHHTADTRTGKRLMKVKTGLAAIALARTFLKENTPIDISSSSNATTTIPATTLATSMSQSRIISTIQPPSAQEDDLDAEIAALKAKIAAAKAQQGPTTPGMK